MKKRPRVLTSLLVLGALVVMLAPSGITWFSFPAYKGLGQALKFLLIAALTSYGGIKQIQAANARGKPLPWWKHSLLIMALFWGCAGVLICLTWLPTISQFFHDASNSPVGTSMLVLFLLLTLSLGIYGSSLLIVQATTSKRL